MTIQPASRSTGTQSTQSPRDRGEMINLLAMQYEDKNGREGLEGYRKELDGLTDAELLVRFREEIPNKTSKRTEQKQERDVAAEIVALEGKAAGSPEAAARLAELKGVSPEELFAQLDALKAQIAANPAAVLGQSPTEEQKAYALGAMRATVLTALQQEHGTASPSGKRTGEESAQFKADVAAVNAMSEDELKAAFDKAQKDLLNTAFGVTPAHRYTGGMRPV